MKGFFIVSLVLCVSVCLFGITQQEWAQQAKENSQKADSQAKAIYQAVTSGAVPSSEQYKTQDALNATIAEHAFKKPSLQSPEHTWKQLQGYFVQAVSSKKISSEDAQKYLKVYYQSMATNSAAK